MVPKLGFGGAPLGELFVKVSEAEAEATLATAWAEGLRYYDTAPLYGHGQSEHRLGRLLYRQQRSDLILSTKVGRLLRSPIMPTAEPEGWIGGLKFEAYYDYSFDGIMRSYEDSLQRLGMTQIDALVVHDLDLWHHSTDVRVTAHLNQLATSGWRALAELKAAGRIRAVGVGINELPMIRRFVELFDIDFFLLALRYTLGDHSALDSDMPLLAEKGIGVVIGAVFSSGLYATGPVPGARFNYAEPSQGQLERVRRIEAICQRHQVPLAAAALQFPMHHPAVASVIPGAFQPAHVKANISHFRQPIPNALWAELKQQRLIHREAPTP
jgi:D-threo-aldose 1-dehydrogenase